jgi:hypothetical protein
MSGIAPHPGDPVTAQAARTPDPHGSRPGLAEPHHVPHGYVHPKEYHHWWWYAGIAAACLGIGLLCVAYWQYETASAPMCARDTETTLTSPDGGSELEVARVSCLGGHERQRILMRQAGGGGTRTVVSFDDKAQIRASWASSNEVDVRQTGGQIGTFEPIWKDVRIRYR